MDKPLLFILKNCPYCVEALEWIRQIKAEDSSLARVEFKIVDEREERELADSYDYYYVPTIFAENKKLHEGAATKEKLRRIMKTLSK